ncbi:MAG: hypothetical protein JWO06_2541 [Bacteroidota bacterium]|nr:hypothetical protein [Bacteroidota bacterium]
MKKISILSLLLLFLSLAGSAQSTILNGGFENWLGSGSSIVPQYWNSNTNGSNIATYGGQTCFRSTTAHSGTYSANVVSGNALGNTINGALTTGYVDAPNFTKAEGFIWGNYNSGTSMAFTGRPDSVVFWYQYTPSLPDNASVEVRLHVGNCYLPETPVNGNHPDSTVNIIARASWQNTATPTTWTRVSVPFVYVDGRTPRYIMVAVTSSANHAGGTSGSSLFIDDIAVIYNPTIATGAVSTGPYYVSAVSGTNISVPFTLTGTYNGVNVITAQLSDANGSFASPVTIGNLTTGTSGTVSAVIPANTPTGSGYRIRVISSSPALTAADNGSNISVILAGNSIAPTVVQNIAANTNGTQLTVSETPAATSRQWEYSTTSGGPYVAFVTAQTGTTYTPGFNTAGTYYVVAVSSYPNLDVTSNEVQVNVVENSITPTSSQSILINANGTTLTVTETPTGTSREWKYGTATGGPYQSFTTAQTATTYTPDFSSTGNYYVVCESVINGITATSNEVLIAVGSVTLTTGTIAGSPFLFSTNAPDANVSVPYATSGTFNGGNIFTAQLSDASGSFTSPTPIGTVNATSSGSISASIPHTTAAGTGYRIRVISSNPVVLGGDNGIDLFVDQFNNSIAPTTTQTIVHDVNGTQLTVTASQSGNQNWEYSTTSGSGYTNFGTAQTAITYTPNFATPGTYYVVCVSKNQYNDTAVSNEVEIDVQNGTSITTSTVSGSPYYVSDSANVQVSVNFTSDVVFNSGNVFTAQLSDNTGSFAVPVNIGTLNGTNISAIISVIPNNSVAGSGFRIRVISSNPAVTGSDNGADLQIIPFEVSLAPADTQTLVPNQSGNAINANSTHPVSTYSWLNTQVSGIGYAPFSPVQTSASLTPDFPSAANYYVICDVTNAQHAKVRSQEVVIIVTAPNGINNVQSEFIKAWWNGNDFMVDLTASKLTAASLELSNVTGQIVNKTTLTQSLNTISTHLPQGAYFFRIVSDENSYVGKTVKR